MRRVSCSKTSLLLCFDNVLPLDDVTLGKTFLNAVKVPNFISLTSFIQETIKSNWFLNIRAFSSCHGLTKSSILFSKDA